MAKEYAWWQRGIIYHIYPRSFADSDGDGVGDLPGIRSKLDYLVWMGVDAVWLSPIYPSPMADFGYDVTDHTDVHPMFGTLADFDELLAEAHHRGLRVLLDYVPNHTSYEHPWFIESRSSRENVHVGEPWALGVRNLGAPEYGEAIEIAEGEVTVFWACGVTPQAVAASAGVPFMITHSPRQMFVTNRRNAEYGV